MKRTFRQLFEEHIAARYDGNAADFSRAMGFTATAVSAWRRGKVTLPQIETRRALAAAYGISHLELLVALGEISEEEARLPADGKSDAVRQLAPIIDADEKLKSVVNHIQSVGQMYAGTYPVPTVEE